MRKFLAGAALVAVIALSGAAMAQHQGARGWDGLDDAKAQGLVGERYDGYVAPVREDIPQDIRPSIQQVNDERLQRYEDIANKNNLDVEAVQGIAGEKLIELTPPGQYVMPQEGEWVQKPPRDMTRYSPGYLEPSGDSGF